MPNYDIKVRKTDDRFDTRILDLKIGNKHISTPSKSLHKGGSGFIKEKYIIINSENIRQSANLGKDLCGLQKDYKEESINLVIPEFTDKHISDTDLENLDCIIHPNSDIIVTPEWSGIIKNVKSDTYDTYWNETKRYIEEVRKINGKLIMGMIPLNIPLESIRLLMSRYIDLDVCSFVLDYTARSARTCASSLRGILKELIDQDIRDESLLCSTNMRKTHDYDDFKPADDLLTFTTGIDLIGNYHKSGRGKADQYKRFIPSKWTYENMNLPQNTNVSLLNENNRIMINDELKVVRSNLEEEPTVMPLVKNKLGAKEYVKSYSVNQTTLIDYNDSQPSWKKSLGFH